MKYSLWIGPGKTWADVLTLARAAEANGYDGIWVADHFMDMGDGNEPTFEALAMLAGLAAAVPRVRLGSLVVGNTYRNPAVLAKTAATIDHISGGRLVLGIGTGWQRNEHDAYGIDLPPRGPRVSMFEEAVQVIKGLFTNDRTDFDGKYYKLANAPLEPKPVQWPLPLLIGGVGPRMLRIAARYGDEWNMWATPEMASAKLPEFLSACEAVGRDPSTVARSANAMVMMSDDETWLEPRRSRQYPSATIVGTPAEIGRAQVKASAKDSAETVQQQAK